MDFMGPMQIESLAGKRYAFVCVNDFSRYTWVDFIKEKPDTFDMFIKLCEKIKNEHNYNIFIIMSDYEREFENSIF